METGFEITNELAINLRQKAGTELPWATITNGATTAGINFDLNPPLGNHQLIMESIDLNSPLMPAPAVLKQDVLDVCIYASNQQAIGCGLLPAAGQANQKTEKETEELVKKIFPQPRLEPTPLKVYSFKFEEPIEIHLGSIVKTQRIGNDPEIEADFGSGAAFLKLLLVPDLMIVQKTAINNADIGSHNVKVTLTTLIDKVKVAKTYKFILIILEDFEQSSGESSIVEV